MSLYRIFEAEPFQKEFAKLFSSFQQKMIRKKMEDSIYPQLRNEPHYGPHIKKLKEYTPETYRYRIGHFRLFYSIDDKNGVVIMTAACHRKDAYR